MESNNFQQNNTYSKITIGKKINHNLEMSMYI